MDAEVLALKLKTYFETTGFKKAVLGLSGGIDSALVMKLAVMALGKENVTVILMPARGISTDHSISDAKEWANELGVSYHFFYINDFLDTYNTLPWAASDMAKMNIQARIRATILYHYANTHSALVLGTGNKTEEMIGYFTKYGDGAADVLPIGNLYKSDVWAMSKALNIHQAIIDKKPSAELYEGHTDEEEIGMNYTEIDEILTRFEKGIKPLTERELLLHNRIQTNAHKSEMPPVI